MGYKNALFLCILIIRACHAAFCQCVCDKHDDCICRPSCILNVRKCTQKLNNKHTVFLHSRSNRKICILKRENKNTGKLALFQNIYKIYTYIFYPFHLSSWIHSVCCSELVTMHVGRLYMHT